MANQIVRAISNLEQVDFKASELLCQAISTAGLDEGIATLLTSAVDSRLATCLDEDVHANASSQVTQHLLDVEQWMTEDFYSLAGNDSKSFSREVAGWR